jgi:hypothetical protein
MADIEVTQLARAQTLVSGNFASASRVASLRATQSYLQQQIDQWNNN